MFKVTVVGNVVADGELRYTHDGKGLFQFRIGVNSRQKNREGEYEDHTDWITIRSMRSTDYLTKAVEKGATAVVVGTMNVGTYQGRDGDTRISLDVWADDIVIRGKAPRSDNGPHEDSARTHAVARAATAAVADADLDDLPF